MEDFLKSIHLHIANEERCNTTLQTFRGASKIGLNVFNNTAIKCLQCRTIYDCESSDHIIHYALGDGAFQTTESNITGKSYIVTQKNMGKLQSMIF